MKTGILKFLGACAAAMSIAMPASAFNVSLTTVDSDLLVSLTGMGSQTLNAYDVFIGYDASLAGALLDVELSSALGDPTDPIAFFLAGTDTSVAGVVEAWLTPFISNDDLALIKTDPLLLFTVHFNPGTDLSSANFAVTSSVFGCAIANPNNPNDSVHCAPGTNVPEPASMALVALALAGAGFARRTRHRTPAAA